MFTHNDTSKTSLSKLENIQKRALRSVLDDYQSGYTDLLQNADIPGIEIMPLRRFVLDDYQSGYTDLLQNADIPGIETMPLRYLTIEVFKCNNETNPAYLNAMFIRKECPYALRDSSIFMRPKVNLTQYGLKSFRNYGAKIWNHLPVPYTARIYLNDFKTLIKSWDGPKCKRSACACKCSICALYT